MSDTLSFSNSFWGDSDRGLDAIVLRLRQGKHTAGEIEAFLRERAAIEDDYAKRLYKLSKSFTTKEEFGTLKDSLETARVEAETCSKNHAKVAEEIKTSLVKPLQDFIASQAATRKSFQATVEKHQKSKIAQVNICIKLKEKYDSKCDEADIMAEQSRQANLTQKDADKLKMKHERAQFAAHQYDMEFKANFDKLTELNDRWQHELRHCCEGYQRMEEDRIQKLRTFLWNFTNFISAACVADDESCERIRQSLEKCNVDQDIQTAIEKFSTGRTIPDTMQYILEKSPHTRVQSNASAFSNLTGFLGSNVPQSANSSPANASPSSNAPQLTLPSLETNKGSTLFPVYPINESGSNLMVASSGAKEPDSNAVIVTANMAAPLPPMSVDRMNSLSESHFGSSTEVVHRVGAAPLTDVPNTVETAEGATHDASNVYHHYDPFDVPTDPAVLFTVRVLYDYTSQSFEELSVNKGDLIPVIVTHEDGWWEGIIMTNGAKRKGLFPSNFVEIVQ